MPTIPDRTARECQALILSLGVALAITGCGSTPLSSAELARQDALDFYDELIAEVGEYARTAWTTPSWELTSRSKLTRSPAQSGSSGRKTRMRISAG